MSVPSLMLAVLLALLLPLEQAHCVWMGLQQHAGPGTGSSASAHACCAKSASARPANPQKAPTVCNCIQLPVVTLPGGIAVVGEAPAAASFLTAMIAGLITAPIAVAAAVTPSVDVGSPPLLPASGAHGLRAPPIPA